MPFTTSVDVEATATELVASDLNARGPRTFLIRNTGAVAVFLGPPNAALCTYNLAAGTSVAVRLGAAEALSAIAAAGDGTVEVVTDSKSDLTPKTLSELVGLGGDRHKMGPWVRDNVADALTDSALAILAHGGARLHMRATRAGSLTGLIIAIDADADARTSGTCTATVTKDGVATALTAQIAAAPNTLYRIATADPGDIPYAAGDKIGVTITTAGTWAPTTADITVLVEVRE